METPTILYETLGPLGETATTADIPPPASSSSEIEPSEIGPSEIETYTVLRNHISLSTIQYPSPETVAPDYFSLDVNEGGGKDATIPEDPRPLPKMSETSTPAAERSLEGNWFHANSRFKSPMLRLHKEILDFCEFLSPTPEEKESRAAAIESVSDVIKYIWPNAEVEVFGSFKTGLYLPSSDIDVVILDSKVKSPQMGLYALSKALSQRGIAKKIQVIAKARVPIIKFVEKRSAVAFDLRFLHWLPDILYLVMKHLIKPINNHSRATIYHLPSSFFWARDCRGRNREGGYAFSSSFSQRKFFLITGYYFLFVATHAAL